MDSTSPNVVTGLAPIHFFHQAPFSEHRLDAENVRLHHSGEVCPQNELQLVAVLMACLVVTQRSGRIYHPACCSYSETPTVNGCSSRKSLTIASFGESQKLHNCDRSKCLTHLLFISARTISSRPVQTPTTSSSIIYQRLMPKVSFDALLCRHVL